MTITIARAKAICTRPELELANWSTRQRVKDLTPARLREKITRARKLRDKYRDLSDQQAREQRGKSTRTRTRPMGDNKNTRLKAQLFQETLDRFETALKDKTTSNAKATGSSKTAAKTGSKKTSKATSKKTSTAKPRAKNAGGPVSKKTQAKKAARKKVVKKKLAAARSASRASSKSTTQTEIQQLRMESYNDSSTGQRNTTMLSQASSPITVRGVAGITKRNQAKRDSRP